VLLITVVIKSFQENDYNCKYVIQSKLLQLWLGQSKQIITITVTSIKINDHNYSYVNQNKLSHLHLRHLKLIITIAIMSFKANSYVCNCHLKTIISIITISKFDCFTFLQLTIECDVARIVIHKLFCVLLILIMYLLFREPRQVP